jgi:hypothetical protein
VDAVDLGLLDAAGGSDASEGLTPSARAAGGCDGGSGGGGGCCGGSDVLRRFVAYQVLASVARLHEAGVVGLDVRPEALSVTPGAADVPSRSSRVCVTRVWYRLVFSVVVVF